MEKIGLSPSISEKFYNFCIMDFFLVEAWQICSIVDVSNGEGWVHMAVEEIVTMNGL